VYVVQICGYRVVKYAYCCILSYTSTGTGGSFTDPALPPNKVTPFVLRITLTAFDGVTTVVVSRNINIGKCRFNHCGLAIESVDSIIGIVQTQYMITQISEMVNN